MRSTTWGRARLFAISMSVALGIGSLGASIAPGATLTVLATDPAAVKDFAAFSQETGHELLSSTAEGEVFRFVLRRRGAP